MNLDHILTGILLLVLAVAIVLGFKYGRRPVPKEAKEHHEAGII